MMVTPCVAASELSDSTTLSEVIVTARRPNTKISAPSPVQMIWSENLSDLGITDIGDAVKRFAGARVKDYGGIGGVKTVSVRNMGASHTLVSYDGVPVSNCQAGQIDVGRFSLDNVEMLSLSVGQNSDMLLPAKLYTAAAVLGITTMKPNLGSMQRTSLKISLSGGSFGYASPYLRLCQRLTESTLMSVEASMMRSDGNFPFIMKNGLSDIKEKRYNSDVLSWQTEMNFFINLSPDTHIDIKGYYYYSYRGLPGAVTLYNPVSTERLWDKNAFVQVSLESRLSDKWKIKSIAKYNFGWNRDREYGPKFSDGIYEASHTQHEGYLSVAAMYSPLDYLTVSAAQDGILNTLSSTMAECPFPKRITSVTALNIKYNLGRLNLRGSIAETYITEHLKTGNAPGDISRLDPSISASYRPFIDKELYIRAMWKHTFRAPSFNDLYYDRLGNKQLRPEKATEYNIGLSWTCAPLPCMEYLTITADGYFNDVTDKIVAFPTTYAWKMANFGNVNIYGADLTLSASFKVSRRLKLNVSGAYTYQRAVDLTDPNAKNYKQQLPYTPENNGNASLTMTTPWFTLGYSMIAVGQRYYMSQNIPANRIDGYVDQSIALSHEFLLGKSAALNVRAEIQNFTDRHYEVIKFYPMPGRSFRLTASLKI